MTDIRRSILWVIFGFSMVLIWDKWQLHNGKPATFFPQAAPVAAATPGLEILSDERIELTGQHTHKSYAWPLRRIEFYIVEQARYITLLTNHFELPASQIAELYKSRWQVELFFKWIKQHLRIKRFLGTSENAAANGTLPATPCWR